MIVIAPSPAARPTPMPIFAQRDDRHDGIFGDRDVGLIRVPPRPTPGRGLFGRLDSDPPPAPVNPHPPRFVSIPPTGRA